MKGSEKVLVALLAFKRTTGLVLILAIILAIPLTLALNQRQQSLQQRAAEITPTPIESGPIPQTIQTIEQLPSMSSDVNGDGKIDITDYNMILRCMNTNYCEFQMVDLNGDGTINTADYELLRTQYFDSQPTP